MTARIGAVILAAGRSGRMGPLNKLLLDVDGRACVRRVADAAVGAGLSPVIAVVGHESRQVADALAELPVEVRDNPQHEHGMGGSIATGIAAMPADMVGAFILLGDMPLIEPAHLRTMAAALDDDVAACVPTSGGRRGNPVLWSGRYFPQLRDLPGDRGARDLLGRPGNAVREVPVEGDGVLVDIDTADAAADLRARLARAAPEPDALSRLARRRPRIEPEPASATRVTLDGRLCPDRVEIALQVEGGTITACACRARGCLLCQAAAGALNEALAGRPVDDIAAAARYLQAVALGDAGAIPDGWTALRAFGKLREFPRRINCILLPFEAASKASRLAVQA